MSLALPYLQMGLQQMQIELSAEQQQKLLDYVALLLKWNSTYNLTALRQEDQMLSHHVLDSLTLLPYLDGVNTLIDVGSGGGMQAFQPPFAALTSKSPCWIPIAKKPLS